MKLGLSLLILLTLAATANLTATFKREVTYRNATVKAENPSAQLQFTRLESGNIHYTLVMGVTPNLVLDEHFKYVVFAAHCETFIPRTAIQDTFGVPYTHWKTDSFAIKCWEENK